MESTSSSLLRNRNFVKLWAGQAVSFIGDPISMVALVILVANITHDASEVGGVLLVRLIPTLAGPFIGVLADRLDRRAILVSSDLARAAITVGFVFVRDLPSLYVLAFLWGFARTLFNPTIRAAFPSVVGSGDMTRANSIISGTFSFSFMVGPALGGVLVASVGVNMAFLLDALSFLASAAFLALIPFDRPQREEDGSFMQEFWDGLRYLAGARVPLALVVGASLIVLTTGFVTPAEVFLAKRTFSAGDAGYGLVVSLWGAGMVLGSAVMGVLGDRVKLLPFFLAMCGYALTLAWVGFSPTFTLTLCALTVAGFSNGVDNVSADTLLQKFVPENILGRVFAVRFLGFSVGEALAYPVGGLLVDSIGVRHTYLLAGSLSAVVIILTLLIMFVSPTKTL